MYRPTPKPVFRDLGPKRNHQIRASEVRLIDAEEENIGVVSLQEALTMAQEAEKDLIEVSPNAKPPVVRIMDYSKYIYEQKKKRKENIKNSKVKEMKEFRFSPIIAENDAAFRIRRAKEFLEKGHNVRITMFRKGRLSQQQAQAKFEEILTNFDGYSTIEPVQKREDRRIYITFKSDGKTEKQKDSIKEAKNDKS